MFSFFFFFLGSNLPAVWGLSVLCLHVLPVPAWVSSHSPNTSRLGNLPRGVNVNDVKWLLVSVLALRSISDMPRVYPASHLESADWLSAGFCLYWVVHVCMSFGGVLWFPPTVQNHAGLATLNTHVLCLVLPVRLFIHSEHE